MPQVLHACMLQRSAIRTFPSNLMDQLPARFALLRMAVGFLGQREQANWWRSSFLSETGLAFAAYNFSRAPRLAAVSATLAAAKRVHDDRIGRARTFHLFRMRLEDEIRIHQAGAENAGGLLGACKLSSKDLIASLEEAAGEMIEAPVGPVQIGKLHDAFTPDALQELAKHYLSAFRRDAVCFPYFAGGRG